MTKEQRDDLMIEVSLYGSTQLKERGYMRLPASLPEAMNLLERSEKVKT